MNIIRPSDVGVMGIGVDVEYFMTFQRLALEEGRYTLLSMLDHPRNFHGDLGNPYCFIIDIGNIRYDDVTRFIQKVRTAGKHIGVIVLIRDRYKGLSADLLNLGADAVCNIEGKKGVTPKLLLTVLQSKMRERGVREFK